MSRKFALEAILSMQDGITRPMRRMSQSVHRQASLMERSVNRIGNAMKDAVGYLGVAGMGGAIYGLGSQFLEFDHNIFTAVSRIENFNAASLEGQQILKAFRDEARKVGAETEHSAGQAAAGLAFFTKAGYKAQQSMALLADTADLASGTDVEFSRAADIASDVLGAFNKTTKDSVLLQQRYKRAMDVMAKATNSANQNMEELFASVVKGAPAFVGAGQSMETFAAMTALLADAGIKGEEAGTGLKTGIIRLQAPASEGSKALRRLGIEMFDSSGKARNLAEVLQEAAPVLAELSNKQRAFAMNAIFGKHHFSKWTVLLQRAATPAMQEMVDKIKDSEGALKNMANIMRMSFRNQLKVMISSIIDHVIRFAEVFRKQGKSGIQSLTESIRALAPHVESFALFMREYGAGFGTLIGLMLTYQTLVITNTLLTKGFVLALGAWHTIISVLTIAQALWNATMLANPIGLIIAAVATLSYLALMLYRNWDNIIQFLTDMWHGPVRSVGAFILKIIELIGRITGLKTVWDATVGGLKGIGNYFFDSSEEGATKQQALTGGTGQYMSPESEGMARDRKSTVDVNLNNTPLGTTIKSTGDHIPEINIALGANPA